MPQGRKYGAGSVFPRKDGKWIAQWELPRTGDRRRRRQLVANSEAAAWRRLRDAQRTEGQSSKSSRSPRSTESVGAFLDRWLDDVVATIRRERTLVGYRAICARVPEPIRDMDLRSPDLPHELNAWLLRLDRHPRTVHHYAACLRGAFAYARRKGLVDTNPATDLTLPAIPRTERIPLTADELRGFLAAVDGPLAPLWVTAAWTGLRSGELLALRWEDVSLERSVLVVRRSLARLPGRRGTRYVLTEPKTERSRRTVPLIPEVVEALRPLRKAYLAQQPELDQGLVFATAAGSPLDASWVNREWTRALAQAGVRRVRLHDLRHAAATMWIQSGMDLATVADLLGHSTITTTVQTYGHLTETHRAEAMRRFRESIG